LYRRAFSYTLLVQLHSVTVDAVQQLTVYFQNHSPLVIIPRLCLWQMILSDGRCCLGLY